MITFKGVSKTRKEWADSLGLKESAIDDRLRRWPIEKALTTPKLNPRDAGLAASKIRWAGKTLYESYTCRLY
jgi:hypothetical protein